MSDIDKLRAKLLSLGLTRTELLGTDPLDVLDSIEAELASLHQQLKDLEKQVSEAHRHEERLKRRLDQNTDRDSLLGEVRRLRHEIDALNAYGENMRKFEARIKPERNRLHEAIQRIAAGPYSIEEARSIASAALQENDKGRKP